MADVAIRAAAVTAAPMDYKVPGAQEIGPKSVSATMDGTSASGTWFPCLQLLDPGGNVMFSAVSLTALAAGASADVSWFPHIAPQTPQAGTSGVVVEQLSCHSTQSGVTSTTVLLSGQTYTITAQGTYSIDNSNLTVGTPNADAMFPTSDSDPRMSTQVGLDPECAFALAAGSSISLGHLTKFQMNLGSGPVYVTPQGGPFATPQPNYLYRYTVVGQGSTATFTLVDSPRNDNYGAIQITIQGPGSNSSGGGGGGSLVPPPTAADNGFVLTDVSGIPEWSAAAGGITDLTSTASTITVTAPTGPTTNVDLPTTGVGAGTYGDSTHVAEVTVDSRGRVTAATAVAISGSGGAGGLVTLYDSGYLGSDAASIDTGAGGIAAGHGNLMVWVYLRTADAQTQGNILGRFNNDSGANYNESRVQANNASPTTSTAIGQTSFLVGIAPGANATANTFGPGTIEVPAYDQTTNKKAGNTYTSSVDSVAADMVQAWCSIQWTSTAAITRLSVFSQNGGNIKAGSRMMVLGTQ